MARLSYSERDEHMRELREAFLVGEAGGVIAELLKA